MPKDDHPPAFQFYVDDFISDSAVDAMTNEELGMYVRLLCKAWKEDPAGTIPKDERILANWAKATATAWKKCREGVLRAFCLEDSRWHQKRMKLEWKKMLERREERKQSGSKGGSKTQAKLKANGQVNGQAKSSLSSSPSVSSSVSIDGDGDGAKEILLLKEDARVRERARRIAEYVPSVKDDERSLIAKVALLWDSGEFSDDDVEQALESFRVATKPITEPAAWFYRCMANRCNTRNKNFQQLLKMTAVPVSLLIPPGVTSDERT